MLSKKERLTRESFHRLLLDPQLKTVYNQLGTLKYTVSTTPGFSVVTSSKHEKRAVPRNTLRRRLYSLFHQNRLKIKAILYVSKQSYGFEYAITKKYLYELLAKTTKNT